MPHPTCILGDLWVHEHDMQVGPLVLLPAAERGKVGAQMGRLACEMHVTGGARRARWQADVLRQSPAASHFKAPALLPLLW